jgi:hypothetical protein
VENKPVFVVVFIFLLVRDMKEICFLETGFKKTSDHSERLVTLHDDP